MVLHCSSPPTSSELAFVTVKLKFNLKLKNYRSLLIYGISQNEWTDEFKSGVKPSIRRTGAEINRLFSFEKICDRNMVAKNGVWDELTLLYEVKSYYINVKLLIMYSYRHLTKKRQKDEEFDFDECSQLRSTIEKESEEGKNVFKTNVLVPNKNLKEGATVAASHLPSASWLSH